VTDANTTGRITAEYLRLAGLLDDPPRDPVPVHWDQYGTPLKKQPDCLVCGDDEIGSSFDGAWCHRCGWHGSLTWLLSVVESRKLNPPAPRVVKGLPSTRAGVTIRRVVCGEREWIEAECTTGRAW
jgi:hypothetical protein